MPPSFPLPTAAPSPVDETPLPAATGLAGLLSRPWFLLLLAISFAALLISRKPEALLHAELWGDEGWSFYPQAYSAGAASLLVTAGGYLDSFQRLVALAVQPLPLTDVPTAFAVVALVVQLLPALFLVSPRMARLLPSPWVRLGLALLYLGLPNELEFYVNLSATPWNLTLLAFLVVVGAPARSLSARLFDGIVLVLSGLSGPSVLLLLPIAAWQMIERGSRSDRMRLILVCLTALVQVGVLLTAPHDAPSPAPLGAGPRMFARIVSLQVILGAELGIGNAARAMTLPLWQDNILPVGCTIAAFGLGLVALWRGSPLLRKFVLFCVLLLAAALASPQVSLTDPQWPMMTHPPLGNRHFTFPVMAWIAIVATLAADRTLPVRLVGLPLLAVILLWAVPHDWPVPRMQPTDFLSRARAFEAAPAGTRMTFPIVPNGLSPMILVKKPG